MRALQPQTFDSVVEGHDGEVFSAAYLPDGTLVATAGWDGCLRLWDPASGMPLLKHRAGNKPLSACAISRDGKRYLTGSMEGILAVWDAATQTPLQTAVAHTRPVAAIAVAPDGQTIATAGWDRVVQLRRLDQFLDVRPLHGHRDLATGCTFFPDGRELLSWSADGTVRGWDVASGGETFLLKAHDDRVTAASLSPDGAQLLTGSRDGKVKLWDLAEQRGLVELELPTEVRGLFFLLDGQAAVAIDAAGTALLLTLPDGAVECEVEVGHKVLGCALAPSGQQVALGGEDGYLYLLAVTGEYTAPLFVTPTRSEKQPPVGLFARLFGGGKMAPVETFAVTCPTCRTTSELKALPEKPFHCGRCRQAIRVNARVLEVG